MTWPERLARGPAIAIGGLTLAAIVGTMWLVAPLSVVAQLSVSRLAMAASGMLVVRAVAGPAAGWLSVVAFGPLLGFAASSVALLGIWVANLDNALHYYWLPHLASAANYHNNVASIDEDLLVESVLVDIGLVAFLCGLARSFVGNVSNRANGPGFPWTLVLKDAELDGFEWIRRNTPPTALMQVDPVARGVAGWAYLPAFAERQMAVGLPISMVPQRKYERGSRVAASLFDGDAAAAHDLARRYGVQYLVVGGPERERHPGVQERFDQQPAYLEPQFRNEEMAIYRVR